MTDLTPFLPIIAFGGLLLATVGYLALVRGRRGRRDDAVRRELDSSRRRATARFRRMERRDRD